MTVRCRFGRIRSDTEVHFISRILDLQTICSMDRPVRSSACACLNVHRQCSPAFYFKRRRVCTLPLAPSCHAGSSYQWQWSMAGTAICNLCPHVCGLVIQRRLDDRVFGLPAARVYLFLPLPFFFVLLPFFLHDDHQSNREHRRTRARFKLTRVFIAALSSGKSPEDPESSR